MVLKQLICLGIKLSANNCAQAVVSQTSWGVRCMDVCADPNLSEPLLALGYSNGKVLLSNLGQNLDSGRLNGKEYCKYIILNNIMNAYIIYFLTNYNQVR